MPALFDPFKMQAQCHETVFSGGSGRCALFLTPSSDQARDPSATPLTCGPANARGLRLKSYIEGDETIARCVPPAYYTGGFPGHVYGGMIASLLDCHGAASAAAFAYRDRGRTMGDGGPAIRFVTASLKVDFKRPTPLGGELIVKGRLTAIAGEIPTEHAIRGLHSVSLLLKDAAPTGAILSGVLGFVAGDREGTVQRYRAPTLGSAPSSIHAYPVNAFTL